jgi:hypothetical protein
VIAAGVDLATRRNARVEGVTLTDRRRIEELNSCEAAVYAAVEHGRLARSEDRQGSVRASLSRACLAAGLNFGVRRLAGDPFALLPTEAQFHDLTIACWPDVDRESDDAPSLSPAELIDLAHLGMQPLLVVRRQRQAADRVLLVYDGTPASSRAIRGFVSQQIAPHAVHRLLAITESESEGVQGMRQMADYCRSYNLVLESGWLRGSPRKTLHPYVEKWQADLVVLGLPRALGMVRRLLGDVAQRLLSSLSCALYAAT